MIRTRTGRNVRETLPLRREGVGLGTPILTADGELPVEFLNPGDRVVTHDAGMQPLSSIVVRRLALKDVVRIRPGVVSPTYHGPDLLVAARQRLFLRDWRAQVMFGKRSALVEAGRLVDREYFERLEGEEPVTLFQLVFADGAHAVRIGPCNLLAASAAPPVEERA